MLKHRLHVRKAHIMNVKGRGLDVLEAVASMNEAYAYNIKKESGITYKTVHSKLKDLKSKELIKFFREKETEKGANAKIFRPTVTGIAVLIDCKVPIEGVEAISDDKKKSILKVINKNQDEIPLVFGKWKLIREVLGEREAWYRLKRASESYIRSSEHKDVPYYKVGFENGKVVTRETVKKGWIRLASDGIAENEKELFTYYFMDPVILIDPEKIRQLGSDQEIHAFLSHLLGGKLEKIKEEREDLRFLKSQLSESVSQK